MLREAERLVPVVDGNDVNVPRVKIVLEGPPNKALPAKFFADELNCILTSEMIKKYDQLKHEFAQRMRKKSWPRDLADLNLLDIQFLKVCEVEWKSTSQQQLPAVSTVGPLSDVGPAAASDDNAPRRSNRSPLPDAGVAAKFEDAAFDFTKWDIYNESTTAPFRWMVSDSPEILRSRFRATLLLQVR